MPPPNPFEQARWLELAFEWGPLHRAAFLGDLQRVKHLLAAGEDPGYRALDQWRPLDAAAWRKELPVLREFLHRDVRPDAHTLLAAARGGSVFAINEVLGTGLSVEASFPEPCGTTALMVAASEGHTDVVRHLLRLGSDVDRRETPSGWTALRHAASGGHADVIRALVTTGADVDTRDSDGESPIQAALGKGESQAVSALLNAGAAPPHKDPKRTLLDVLRVDDVSVMEAALDRWGLDSALSKRLVQRAEKEVGGAVASLLRTRWRGRR